MDKIETIGKLAQQGVAIDEPAMRAVLQALQLGYSLAEMDNETKKAG